MGEPIENAIPEPNGPGANGVKKTGGRKRTVIIATVAVLAVIAAGGMVGWKAYADHQVSVARSDCQAALVRLDRSARTYGTLLKADDTTAALKVKAADVKDAKTVDTLAAAAKSAVPKRVACTADNTTALDKAKDSADRATARYGRMTRSLDRAVKAVESSKLDKTVADATKLLNDTKGRVKDEKTRDSLAKAVKARDAQAIARAVKAVNDSKAAKEKADAEAAAKAKADQASQAAVPQSSNAGNTYSSGNTGYSYSGGTGYSSGTYSGYSYSGGSGRSYSNGSGSNGGAVSSGGGNSGGSASGNNRGGSSSSGSSSNSSNESSSGMPNIPSTSGCTASITGQCSTSPSGEVWW